ncbi:MAG: complex I NDUFA9 subunit family protein [Alphaproteobacteria bacterium]|nr:MAG: complex I NDUFA9 subunit family protein [Alphaproteobacteria bacterium]
MNARLVTIFGGSGFVGRYLVQHLARRGARIRVAVRHPQEALFLKPLGQVGQIHIMQANVRHAPSVAAAVAGADMVINLVGILHERGRQRFRSVHVEGARHVAEAARAAGARHLLHMSALGADPDSPSRYARSKAEGEAAVRAVFPRATIMRPSIIFGPEDDFFNRFARLAKFLPFIPVIAGETRFQPVYVGDVAEAFARAALDGGRPSRAMTYELGGPCVYTFRELLEIMRREAMIRRPLMPVPMWLARLKAAFLGLLPNPPITLDQLRLLGRDNVVQEGAAGLADLGIRPTPLEAILPTYMRLYRPEGAFSRPLYED